MKGLTEKKNLEQKLTKAAKEQFGSEVILSMITEFLCELRELLFLRLPF